MNQQFLYLTDPLTLAFETEVQESLELPDGRLGVILNRTYFYPTGGGQEHDIGVLGSARVLDVFKSEDGQSVIHVLDGDPGEGVLRAAIDHERRIRHMQHHTAQHLVSGCFQQFLKLETLSSGIHGYDPTTIDLPDTELSRADLDPIEKEANQIIFENRLVKSYFVPAEKINTIPLRRPPKVEGEIRIIEIEGFDYSACGGTHCPQTGMIGAIKIIRTERINQKSRIHFVAGIQAMEHFHQYQEIVAALAADFSTHPSELIELVRKQAKQLQTTEKELRQLQLAYSAFEAQDLIARAQPWDSIRLIIQTFENRAVGELRTLANTLKAQPDLVAMLATYDGEKLVLLVTCGEATLHSARELLNQRLNLVGGRGGGDDRIAQGGGIATPEQFAAIFTDFKLT